MAAQAPIKVLQLVHGYPPAVGGAEISVADLCTGLVRDHGFDVTVLTTDAYTVANFKDPSLPTIPIQADEVRDGVRVRRFPVHARRSRLLEQPQRVAYKLRLPGNDWLRTWYNGPLCPGMQQAVRTSDADVICAAAFPLNHMLYPFRRPDPRPVVLMPSAHTAAHWGYERPNLLRLTRRAYATIARTEHERDWLVERGAPSERVHVIGHGIEPGELRPRHGAFRAEQAIPPEGYLVAYLGQLAGHKGIDVLVRGFPALLEHCPDAWLAIGGAQTPFVADLRRQLDQLPAAARDRCRLVVGLSEQQKADLLGDCDVMASPSAYEAFGLTTLEAWSLRKPVVVGDSPSQACIVDDGVSGFIVAHGDERALTDALAVLGEDATRREAMGGAGHARLLARFRRRDLDRRHAALLADAAEAGGRDRSARAPRPVPTKTLLGPR